MSPDFLKPRQSTHKYPTDFLLGDLLVKAGILSQKQLDDAVHQAGGKHLNVGQTLIVARYITARDLQAAVDAQSALRDRVVDMNTAIRGLKSACRAGIPFSEAVRVQDPGATKSIPTNKLGELLLEANIINGDQFGKALQRSLSTGLPLGRILVLNGAISETLLTTALEIQVRVRDDMLTREEAIDYLMVTANQNAEDGMSAEKALKIQALLKAPRKTGIRLGELLVLAGVLGETDVMNALELGLVNDQPIGQILVAQGFVSPELLESALRMQDVVDSGHIDGQEAAERLRQIHESGLSFSEVVSDIEIEEAPRPEINFQAMLTLANVVTEDQIQAAFDLALTSPHVVATVLMLTGQMDEATGDAALKCHSMILDGYLSQEDALVGLDYWLQKIVERPITYEEALQELGWSLPPELIATAPTFAEAYSEGQTEERMSFAVESGETDAVQVAVETDQSYASAPEAYDDRNGDEAMAAAEDNGSYAAVSEEVVEAKPPEHVFEEAPEVAAPSGDWTLPQANQPVETNPVSEENSVEEVSAFQEQVVDTSISSGKVTESAHEITQSKQDEEEKPKVVPQPPPPIMPAADKPSKKGVFKTLSTVSNNQPALPPVGREIPIPPPRDFAEATIDPDSAIAFMPVGSLRAGKPPELELSAEEQSIIARASSLGATLEDIEAAARIVGRKQESLRTSSSHPGREQSLAGMPLAESKKKIGQSQFDGPVTDITESAEELPDAEEQAGEDSELGAGKPKFEESGLGAHLGKGKSEGTKSGALAGKSKTPPTGLGAHLGKPKNGAAVPGKGKFEDSGLSAHLGKPKSRGGALGTLLGKSKFEDNGRDKQSGKAAAAASTSLSDAEKEELLANLGAHLEKEGHLKQSVPANLSGSSAEIASDSGDDKPFTLNESMIRLAESFYEQGKYADAENLYERILTLREAEAGPSHPTVVGDLNNLAGVLCVQGKFGQAEMHVERAVKMIEELESGETLKLADSLNTLAGIYYQQDKFEQCERLLTRALKIRQNLLGEDHQDIADNLRDYAKFLRKTNRPEEAEKIYAQAKDILARVQKGKDS